MSFNSNLVKNASSTVVALNGVTTGTITAGPVLNVSGAIAVEWESLCANVSAAITTSSLVIKTLWQGSNDNSTWNTIYGLNGAAPVAVAATGTGSLVTTGYIQHCSINPSYPYMRLAVLSSGATGAAGDNVTISYNFKKRSVAL